MNSRIFSMFAAVLLGLLLMGAEVGAQTIIDNTTLVGTIDATTDRVSLASVTCTGCTFGQDTMLYVDNEAMQVTAAYTSGTTAIPVIRGVAGTKAARHLTAATVFVGTASRFKAEDPPLGRCLRSEQPFMPWINVKNGVVWGCNNLTWFATVTQTWTFNSRTLQ